MKGHDSETNVRCYIVYVQYKCTCTMYDATARWLGCIIQWIHWMDEWMGRYGWTKNLVAACSTWQRNSQGCLLSFRLPLNLASPWSLEHHGTISVDFTLLAPPGAGNCECIKMAQPCHPWQASVNCQTGRRPAAQKASATSTAATPPQSQRATTRHYRLEACSRHHTWTIFEYQKCLASFNSRLN